MLISTKNESILYIIYLDASSRAFFALLEDYEVNSYKTKNTVPAAIAMSAKTVSLVRLQGLEPWTP